MISAPCFSVVPAYLEATDALAFLPARAIEHLDLVEIDLEHTPDSFDVIAAWHPRYHEDPTQQWIISLLKEEYTPKT